MDTDKQKNENKDNEQKEKVNFFTEKVKKVHESETMTLWEALFLLFVLVCGFILGFFVGYRFCLSQTEASLKIIQDSYQKNEAVESVPVDLSLIESDPVITYGNKDADLNIKFFNDLQCPYCERLILDTVNKAVTELKDTAYIELYDYPLDIHANAKNAAVYARCYLESGGNYLEYITMLSNTSGDWADKDSVLADKYFLDSAVAAGADEENMKICAASEETYKAVEANISDGQKLNIQSTPSYIVNGSLMSGYSEYDSFMNRITSYLTDGNPAAEAENTEAEPADEEAEPVSEEQK